MGPDPFFRVLVEKKNSLCGRNAWGPCYQGDTALKKESKFGVRCVTNKKIYYSYFIAVIELRG